MFKKGILLSTVLSVAVSFTNVESMKRPLVEIPIILGTAGVIVAGLYLIEVYSKKIYGYWHSKPEEISDNLEKYEEEQPVLTQFVCGTRPKDIKFTIGLRPKSDEAKKLLQLLIECRTKKAFKFLQEYPKAVELYDSILDWFNDLGYRDPEIGKNYVFWEDNGDGFDQIADYYLTIDTCLKPGNSHIMEVSKKFAKKIQNDFEIFGLFYEADGPKASTCLKEVNDLFDASERNRAEMDRYFDSVAKQK